MEIESPNVLTKHFLAEVFRVYCPHYPKVMLFAGMPTFGGLLLAVRFVNVLKL